MRKREKESIISKTSIELSSSSSSYSIPWEINEATLGIPNCFKNMILRLRNQDNALTIARFILATKNEINLSDSYRKSLISNLLILSKFYDNKAKAFSEMTRDDLQTFLNSFRKPEPIDPLHKWIGTYNHFIIVISKFFKWLYNPDLPSSERQKQLLLRIIKIYGLRRPVALELRLFLLDT